MPALLTPEPSTEWISILAVPVIGLLLRRTRCFFNCLGLLAKTIAATHCAYLWRDGLAELIWVG